LPAQPRIDRIDILGRFQGPPRPRGQTPAPPPPPLPAVEWTWTLMGSEDGQNWKELARASGKSVDGAASLPFAAPAASRFYRLELRAPETSAFRIADLNLFQGNEAVQLAGPHHFHSSWKSEGAGEEWVYVDLGAPCTFDRVTLHWLRRAAEGALQVSADAVNWTTLESLPRAQGAVDEIRLATPGKGRYVRVLMTKPAFPDGYILSEVEVWGRGGPVPRPKPSPTHSADGRLSLAGGNWRLQRDSLVQASGEQVSRPGFGDAEWAAATVPGTTLVSYINLGAVPDPNFGENEVMISDSFFYADFWYRREFTVPTAAPGRRFWLNFDGVNWKAEVFLNGARLGRVDGAFMRGRFDATDKINRGGRNVLAVRVIKNATPGAIKEKGRGSSPTGGPVGADNPTFHASAGWDWMSTIRGRNTGIWSNIYLTQTGPVAIEDPRVETRLPLPDTSRADVIIEAALRNTEARPVLGTLRVRFGDAVVEVSQSLAASETRVVKLDPAAHPQLRLSKPRLWWPNGYGDPDLYPVELTFTTASKSRMGLLIWMSHSAWPSILWQTYDYFFNPDGDYFGSKKGAERLHIQWNRAADAVEVVNYNAGDRRGLTAKAEIFDLDGSLKWQRSASLDAPEDSTSAPIKPEYPSGLAPVHFIRLTLLEAGKAVSSNFYLRPAKEDDYSAIRGLPKVTLEAETRIERRGPEWLLTTRLRNTSRAPALMVRAKAVRDKTGDRILPALYDDNYIALMPGESFEIRTGVKEVDTRGERPRIAVEGFNLERIVER
jgi:hypothetical protein